LEALKKMTSPKALIRENGHIREIPASDLIPGDEVILDAGRQIPADLQLTEVHSLKVEESALTGESVPVDKDLRKNNRAYMSTNVTYGRGVGKVTAIGMDTEIGKIAKLINEAPTETTPLQKRLADLGKVLSVVSVILCVALFIIAVAQKRDIMEMLITAISLAVAAVPEGLPAIVTMVLALSVSRMVKVNTIVKRLPSVETLGCVSVVCSDKTGTLTQNKMTVVSCYCDGKIVPPNDLSTSLHKHFLEGFTLCNDASIDGERIGDPTELALLDMSFPHGLTRTLLENRSPRVSEIAFDSDRKMMTTMHRDGKTFISYTKGSPEEILKRCTHILYHGRIEPFTLNHKKEILCAADGLSSKALRLLALGMRIPSGHSSPAPQPVESGLTFVGLVGMIDPPRPEAKVAVETCRKAGIKPVMITGDHVITASAIARELGILEAGDRAITGAELDQMTDRELDEQVESISVYARVSPENKIRIVKAWQRRGQVVSMTGDGVNDAPALKAADIGCAMGITGTDVAKGAADMTLTDDNFATIVDAVREGRGIYANIKKVVGFLLGTNIGEVITVFVAMLLWHKTPLLSMQLLMINLVTDSLPAIALGMEAVESDVMMHKPKPKNEGLFAHGFGVRIVLQGVMFGVLSLIAFKLGETQTGLLEGGQTLAFMVLALSQVVQAFNMRSEHSLFKIGVFTNKVLNKAALISIALVSLVLFTPVRSIFGLVALSGKQYLIGLGLAVFPVLAMEFSKACGLIKHHK